ncbi:MAG: TetR family transcriptional regulator C-terminal domain-containing protein [Pseudomonadota bacterium]
MTQETKERLLEVAAKLFHHQGYHATGLQQILREAGVPKGSFYFYFKSKEELALGVIDYFDQRWAALASEMLDDASQPPLGRLRRFFAWFRDYFEQNGYTGGCPVGNLAQEMSDLNPLLAQKVAGSITAMAGKVEAVLEEAQRAGHLAPGWDTRQLAFFIVSSWHGSLIRMKACKSPESLITFEKIVFDGLLA